MPYRLATSLKVEAIILSDAALRRRQTVVGWVKGLEPSTPGTTIRCSNQLSYTHHMKLKADALGPPATRRRDLEAVPPTLARQEGFEPPAYCLEGSCSILLSYWRRSRYATAYRTCRRLWSG